MSAAPSSFDSFLRAGPVIAVATLERAEDARPLAAALAAGGVRVLEVTLRTRAALAAIEAIALQCPEVVVGAGTVLAPGDFAAAADAGARFAVSPGFTARLAAAAHDSPLPWLPGVATASEVMAALDAGLERLKFFPAEAAGGPAALRALGAVFPNARFCPTGGIDAGNAARYLALANVDCVAGSWLAPMQALAGRDWRAVEALASAAAALRGERTPVGTPLARPARPE
jgi:2-dehydro-3-deoxyphosphogluconate aldolase/(4S)-4-hydroxy-2-oxoglutarate aldolase